MRNDDGTYTKPDRSVAEWWACSSFPGYVYRAHSGNAVTSYDNGSVLVNGGHGRWLPVTLPTFPKPEPPKPLVFEAGKYYRTRDGEKLFFVGTRPIGKPLVFQNSEAGMALRNTDGTMWSDKESSGDLIAEWTDEPPRVKVPRLFRAKYEGEALIGVWVNKAHYVCNKSGVAYIAKSCDLTDITYLTPEYEDEL